MAVDFEPRSSASATTRCWCNRRPHPVPIQAVRYEDVIQIERTKPGIGAGKAVAIGVATGVGAFFGVLALLFAAAIERARFDGARAQD